MDANNAAKPCLWRLGHLVNTLHTGLCCFLSLDALHRGTNMSNTTAASVDPYIVNIRAQVSMLSDCSRELGSLLQHAAVQGYYHNDMCERPLRALVNTANRLLETVGQLVFQMALGNYDRRFDRSLAAAAGRTRMLDAQEIASLHKLADELRELCDGNMFEGTVGWGQCWAVL